MEEIKEQIKVTVESLREKLKGQVTGYSFLETNIVHKISSTVMTSKIGFRMVIDGKEETMGADVKYDRRIPNGRQKEYVTLDVHYSISHGRDMKFVVSDQIDFVVGDSRSRDSLYNIPMTNIIFRKVERVLQPVRSETSLPLF